MLDVQEHRGQVRAGVSQDFVENILLRKDIVPAVLLLHVRGEVVQDVFLQLVPHFSRACDT